MTPARSASAVDGVTAAAYADALARSADALAWIRARHADGKLPLLRLPEKTDDLAGIKRRAKRLAAGARRDIVLSRHRRLEPRRPDGGAARRLRRAGRSGRCATARACTSWTISIPTPMPRCWRACRSPRTRFVAVSKSGGTGETLMQTIAALAAVRAAGLAAATCPTLLRHHRAGGRRPAQRPARSPRRARRRRCSITIPTSADASRCSPMSGLLPAAVAGLDIAAIRRGAAAALAPVLAGSAARRGPRGASAPRSMSRSPPPGQADRGADGLCRSARALHPLVRPAVGGEPRQGRQGHDADRGARAGRPAQPAPALHRRPARQAVHGDHRRLRRATDRGSIAGLAAAAGEPGLRRQDHRRPRRRARAAPPPRRWRRTAARCAPSSSTASTRRASANC